VFDQYAKILQSNEKLETNKIEENKEI